MLQELSDLEIQFINDKLQSEEDLTNLSFLKLANRWRFNAAWVIAEDKSTGEKFEIHIDIIRINGYLKAVRFTDLNEL